MEPPHEQQIARNLGLRLLIKRGEDQKPYDKAQDEQKGGYPCQGEGPGRVIVVWSRRHEQEGKLRTARVTNGAWKGIPSGERMSDRAIEMSILGLEGAGREVLNADAGAGEW
jgi:hypothetical protein